MGKGACGRKAVNNRALKNPTFAEICLLASIDDDGNIIGNPQDAYKYAIANKNRGTRIAVTRRLHAEYL